MRREPVEVYSLRRMPSLSKQRHERRHRSIARGLVVCAIMAALPALGAPKRPKKDTAPPVVEHTALERHDGKGPVLVQARIVDDSAIFEPTLLVRTLGGGAFTRVPLVEGADHLFAAEVPPALLVGDVEYLVEAFDENGNGPSRVGDEGAPMLIKRDAPVVPPLTTTPTPPVAPVEEDGSGLLIAGVVVGSVVLLGAAAGIGFAVYALRPPAPDAVRIVVTGPAPIAGAL